MRSIKTTEELVNILEKEGELIRVKDPIDVHYEITAIQIECVKQKTQKLYFLQM